MSSGASGLRVVAVTVVPQFPQAVNMLLQQRGHRLVAVLTAPGPRSRRSDDYLSVAQQTPLGVDVILSNHRGRWADLLRVYQPDLLFCGGFNWKLPAELLDLPRLGAYNMHDSLLPKYRGRNAIGWALRNDEPVSGVTFHRMTSDFDTGPLLAQVPYPIVDDDDADTILQKFVAAFFQGHLLALQKLEAGDPGDPQDESQATHASGAFEPAWRWLDWSKPARDTHLQVRSWYGVRDVPRGAFGVIDGSPILITKTRLLRGATSGAAPGTIMERRVDRSLVVQCADAPLEIVSWQPVSLEEAGSESADNAST